MCVIDSDCGGDFLHCYSNVYLTTTFRLIHHVTLVTWALLFWEKMTTSDTNITFNNNVLHLQTGSKPEICPSLIREGYIQHKNKNNLRPHQNSWKKDNDFVLQQDIKMDRSHVPCIIVKMCSFHSPGRRTNIFTRNVSCLIKSDYKLKIISFLTDEEALIVFIKTRKNPARANKLNDFKDRIKVLNDIHTL